MTKVKKHTRKTETKSLLYPKNWELALGRMAANERFVITGIRRHYEINNMISPKQKAWVESLWEKHGVV